MCNAKLVQNSFKISVWLSAIFVVHVLYISQEKNAVKSNGKTTLGLCSITEILLGRVALFLLSMS